jgi:predicted ATPase
MIFEDAHWTDPTSLELFGRAVDRIASLRVLLIVTFRPEFAHHGSDGHTSLPSPSPGWRSATSTP